MKKLKEKVICAMSGGVDSSVAAALLKKDGYDVFGFFMRLNDFSANSEKRARKVAKILNIPFKIFDLRKEFKKRVVKYFLDGYKEGITPNPCVVCNKEIKFGLLLKKALKSGVDYVATGHYACIRKFVNSQQIRYSLMKAEDKNKDQSYFLWKLSHAQLKHILFPIGDYTRAEVEKMARDFKLPFSNVKKSVEICFVPKTTEDFLKKYLKLKKGDIVDNHGKVLERHDGLALYTIGQRKGIKLPQGPYYVLDKNLKKNQLIVTKNEKDLLKNKLMVGGVSWISGNPPKLPLKVSVKIRYRTESVPAKIYKILNTKYKILFIRPQRAVTPGQSAVFYLGRVLLGGGIIC